MEWNSRAPMELLSHMPQKLTRDNLEKIQSVIDNDKYICSTVLSRDLCGEYAPFCSLCNRSMSTPCAVAYLRMMHAEGIKLEIAISDSEAEQTDNSEEAQNNSAVADVPPAESAEITAVEETVGGNEAAEQLPKETNDTSVEVAEVTAAEVNEEPAETESHAESVNKNVIRIAVAKRKK